MRSLLALLTPTHHRPPPALLTLIALLAGCSRAAPAHSIAGCASPAPPAVLDIAAALLDGRASPAPHRVPVARGSAVQVRVTTDKVVPIHIHGYDLEYDAAPGAPGCASFVADRAGLFDVEAHPDTLLLQLEVR
jgi:hypothetical protein